MWRVACTFSLSDESWERWQLSELAPQVVLRCHRPPNSPRFAESGPVVRPSYINSAITDGGICYMHIRFCLFCNFPFFCFDAYKFLVYYFGKFPSSFSFSFSFLISVSFHCPHAFWFHVVSFYKLIAFSYVLLSTMLDSPACLPALWMLPWLKS